RPTRPPRILDRELSPARTLKPDESDQTYMGLAPPSTSPSARAFPPAPPAAGGSSGTAVATGTMGTPELRSPAAAALRRGTPREPPEYWKKGRSQSRPCQSSPMPLAQKAHC